MIKIELNLCEQKLANYIAKGREENNTRKGFKERKQDAKRSSRDINLEGVCGEIAACKAFDRYPDTEFNVDSPPKHDMMSPLGFTVDVKTAEKGKEFWSAAEWKNVGDVERYLFVRGRCPEYEICGWARPEEFINPRNVTDVGNGKFYKISMDAISTLHKGDDF
tara:strand:- start:38 stop:529 length:492 start_codon:yes stop_codon:yes gene_type:complete